MSPLIRYVSYPVACHLWAVSPRRDIISAMDQDSLSNLFCDDERMSERPQGKITIIPEGDLKHSAAVDDCAVLYIVCPVVA